VLLSLKDMEVRCSVGMERLSLSLSLSEEAPWRGPWGGGSSFTGGPGRYVKKGSGYEHLSIGSPLEPR